MSDTEPEVPPYDLRPSGVVYVVVKGERKTLRAPLMGELRKLRGQYVALREQASDLIEPLRAEAVKVDEECAAYRARAMNPQAREQRIYELEQLDPIAPRSKVELDRLKKADKAKPLTAAERKKGNDALLRQETIAFELDEQTADLWGGWSRDTFTAMGLTDVPPPAELDPAFSTQRFVAELLAHWRDCPPGRGR